MSVVVVTFQTFLRPQPVTVHASVRTSVHLVGPVTLPMMIWGTISLLLNLGQNLDPQMIMSEASRDARFRTSLGEVLCLPPTHSSTRGAFITASLYRMLQRPMSWSTDYYPPERSNYTF